MQWLMPFPWKQSVGSQQCTSGFSHTTQIPTRTLCGSMYVPASMDVGMGCCRRSTNRNILSWGGRNPNCSAVSTTANPMGGNKKSLEKVIAIVDLIPNCELPGPAIQFPHFHSSENWAFSKWHIHLFFLGLPTSPIQTPLS